MAVPEPDRAGLLARLLREADGADAHRLRTGRAHPLWGTGSLMSAARGRALPPEPFCDDPNYAACMAMVFEALVARAMEG